MKFFSMILALLFGQVVFATEPEFNAITVNGQGVVSSAPDILEFSVFVEERGETAEKLVKLVNDKSEKIVDLLMDQGVHPRDIQSMQVNLYPWFERERNYGSQSTQVQKGFVISRHVKVTLRNFDRYAALLDGLTKIGAQRIDGFRYRIEDTERLYLKALDKALEDAKQRAKGVAKGLSIKLGDVLAASELSSYSAAPERMMARSFADNSGGFLPGEMNISATVSVKFAIIE